MSKLTPYIIQHFQLDEFTGDPDFPLIHQSGYYCLFWWKQIPLGHLFIECNNRPGKDEFRRQLLKEIQPAVEYYIQQTGKKFADYQAAFTHDRFDFAEILHAVFAEFTPLTLPERVDISVVICTRNRSRSLQRCLDLLMRQKCLPTEIIVIDNAPVDDSTFKVTEQYRHVKYYKEPRAGLDIARNTGAHKASSSVVAYVDDDVLVHPWWAYQVWQSFNDPQVAAITGLVIASALNTESQQIFEKYWSFNRGYTDRWYNPAFYQENLVSGPPVWEIGAGANMAFRKSIFAEVGYFDERLDVGAAGCSGDSEIWYRILAKGFNIQYNPRAVVHHEHREDLKALHKQLYNYMRGHAAAALIQQTQNEKAGYRKRLYRELPKYYMHLLAEGFPAYNLRHRTLFSEIRGLVSGVLFYRKYKSRPAQTDPY